MKISLQWLREYIPFDLPPGELADRLTHVGFEVESIEKIGPSFEGVVVARVMTVEAHPKADKLKICRVDTGRGVRSVVCGAPNVQAGQTVPLAEIGARLHDQSVIEPVVLRGVPSDGMICSERELGMSGNHNGILVLDPARYLVGQAYDGGSPYRDVVFEVNVTPNRPDCLSHFGIAREVGVFLGKPLFTPPADLKEKGVAVEKRVSVQILDKEKCQRYSARLIENVTIGPSPKWLSDRLEAVGLRSINNVVDITNYVMLETGQPLHAFDLDRLSGNRIVVRSAADGETFTTLDGQNHLLNRDDLLICDGERGVALAGVMGGSNSEISGKTRRILLESACFHPMTVRKTAKRLNISTEASQRFERGTDPNGTIAAADRASRLLEELAGGTVAKGLLDVYPESIQPCQVVLEKSRLSGLLGAEIPDQAVKTILSGLGFVVQSENPYRIEVPTFRRDVKRDVDVIEEIVRHYGYDKIEPRLHSMMTLPEHLDPENEFCENTRDIIAGFGLLEVLNNSLVSQKHVRAFNGNRIPVSVRNPLSPDNSLLRTSLLPGLLDSIAWNRNRSTGDLNLFEIGRVFFSNEKLLPDERPSLAGVMTGMQRVVPFWNEKNRSHHFYDVKGLVEAFLRRLHIDSVRFTVIPVEGMRPESSLAVTSGETEFGFLGEIMENVLKQWDIDAPVFAFTMDIQRLLAVLPVRSLYRPIPRFPSVRRDLAFVVDESAAAGELQNSIFKTGGEWICAVEIFDLYRGQQVAPGKKSIAFSLQFSNMERTLKEEEIDPIIRDIVRHVEERFSASLRA
jgi:phenylalanyl-tRNA synthetase beta chain